MNRQHQASLTTKELLNERYSEGIVDWTIYRRSCHQQASKELLIEPSGGGRNCHHQTSQSVKESLIEPYSCGGLFWCVGKVCQSWRVFWTSDRVVMYLSVMNWFLRLFIDWEEKLEGKGRKRRGAFSILWVLDHRICMWLKGQNRRDHRVYCRSPCSPGFGTNTIAKELSSGYSEWIVSTKRP